MHAAPSVSTLQRQRLNLLLLLCPTHSSMEYGVFFFFGAWMVVMTL